MNFLTTLWPILGLFAAAAAILNIIFAVKGKNHKVFMFASLSLTSLTLCSFYSMIAKWGSHNDWGALQDVTPTVHVTLWFLTIISILMNSVPLFIKKSS